MMAQLEARADLSQCPAGIDGLKYVDLATVPTPQTNACHPKIKHGFPVADPKCTPGSTNPTLTLAVLSDADFRTGCVRDHLSSATAKNKTYEWYGLTKPDENTGSTQTCELDHLIPLYIGGADDLANIWPQCGPTDVTLMQRYFKQKDQVEVYIGIMVRKKKIKLADAQKGMATDWTQYLSAMKKYCATNRCSASATTIAVD